MRDPWASGGSTVLVVEDEPDVRESIIDLLEGTLEDTRVLAAESGEQGLEALAATHVDLIISDQKLPGMDGLRFLHAARLQAPGAPRILMTAFADLQVDVDEVNEAHVECVCLKPLDATQFVATVQAALRRSAGPARRAAPAGRNVRDA